MSCAPLRGDCSVEALSRRVLSAFNRGKTNGGAGEVETADLEGEPGATLPPAPFSANWARAGEDAQRRRGLFESDARRATLPLAGRSRPEAQSGRL